MTTLKQMLAATLAIGVLYVGAYAYLRATRRIVHRQNHGAGPQQVLASPDPWDDLLVDMSKGKPALEAYARGQKGAPGFVNAAFWPLRTIEASVWNWKNE